MKIKFVVEKSNKRAIINFTKKEIRDLHDWLFLCDDECKYCTHNKRLNKIEIKPSIYKKFSHIIHYIMNEGQAYEYKKDKFRPCKEKYYIIKKPNWK